MFSYGKNYWTVQKCMDCNTENKFVRAELMRSAKPRCSKCGSTRLEGVKKFNQKPKTRRQKKAARKAYHDGKHN